MVIIMVMTVCVTATEAKTRLLQLLDSVEAGEEVEITRRGRLVARIVPARAGKALAGFLRGVARDNTDDEADLFHPIPEEEVDFDKGDDVW